jgi:glycosyltransferase involved in cell wall biosynthesis
VATDASRVLGRATVVSHAVMVGGRDNFGPAHNVVEYLVAEGIEVEFVLHPLGSSGSGVVRHFRAGKLVSEETIGYSGLGRLREILYNARLGIHDRAEVLVIVDPINFATVGWAGKLCRRHGLIVYYTADYADRRFANPLANRVYHGLDRIALRAADVVWCVSQRIADKRREQGVSELDTFVVSNAPSFDEGSIIPFEARDPEAVVMVGSIDAILDMKLLLDTLSALRSRRPGIRVAIVGTGSDTAQLKSEIEHRRLEANVQLTGYLPRTRALDIVGRSRVGLCFYSGRASWNVYGDSVKVREYLSLGVPVVSTHNHPLAAEVEARRAGLLVETGEQAAAAVEALLGSTGIEAAARAAEMGRAYDRDTILRRVLADLSTRLS